LTLDIGADHLAYIISEARRKNKRVLEVSVEAEKEWTMECLKRAAWFSAVAGCTPGYINSEGEAMKPGSSLQERMKLVQAAGWGEGVANYVKILEDWRAAGDLKGYV
jgi:hypothetical protein